MWFKWLNTNEAKLIIPHQCGYVTQNDYNVVYFQIYIIIGEKLTFVFLL